MVLNSYTFQCHEQVFIYVLMTKYEFLQKNGYVAFHPGRPDVYYTTWHIWHTDVIILQ